MNNMVKLERPRRERSGSSNKRSLGKIRRKNRRELMMESESYIFLSIDNRDLPSKESNDASFSTCATHSVMSDWSLPNSFYEHPGESRETPEESLHRNTEEQTQSNMVMVQRGHRRRYQEKGLKRLSLAIKSLPREIELSNAEEEGGSGIFQWCRI